MNIEQPRINKLYCKELAINNHWALVIGHWSLGMGHWSLVGFAGRYPIGDRPKSGHAILWCRQVGQYWGGSLWGVGNKKAPVGAGDFLVEVGISKLGQGWVR